MTDQAGFDWLDEARLAYEAAEAAFREHAAQLQNVSDLRIDWPSYYAEWDRLEEATDLARDDFRAAARAIRPRAPD